jgi:hypothetical protein
MEKDTSFLLTGIKFNTKRFAGDFSRFKVTPLFIFILLLVLGI